MSRETLGVELTQASTLAACSATSVRVIEPADVPERISSWSTWVGQQGFRLPGADPRWLNVLRDSMRHEPYVIEQVRGNETVGLLPLLHMRSTLFGSFLVGLPYLNVGGVLQADKPGCDPHQLIDCAINLADDLKVRHLELRHEFPFTHERINQQIDTKVNMRLELPAKPAALWDQLKSKVRNQVRKATKNGVEIGWGRSERLDEFYHVFAMNMRDLGTPVFSKKLFAAVLETFEDSSELCIASYKGAPIAAALLVHGRGVTEVPSASSLREFNHTCANMKMYWHLLERTIERGGQKQFDFGRTTRNSQTFRFKKQWGAEAVPACWQFYVRHGSVHSMRPEAGRFSFAIRIWKRLPIGVANFLGPLVIRGVP